MKYSGPAWMPFAHLVTTGAFWALCIALGLSFGAPVGWALLIVVEARVVLSVAIRRYRGGRA